MARYLESSSAGAGVGECAAEARERLHLAARQRRIATRSLALTELLLERDDLAGVYEAADLAAELVRWSA